MISLYVRRVTHIAAIFLTLSALSNAQKSFNTIPAFSLSKTTMHIRQTAQPGHTFTVTGSTGAILGLQNGSIELWELPTKVFSSLQITAELDGYSVPINLNEHAAAIDVEPDHTTITYSHAAITVRQHMFVPAGDKVAGGAIVFFEIESIKPVMLTFSLEPSMVRQWPAPQYGRPSVSWSPMGSGGGYVLSTDNPNVFGFVAMPNATPGIIFPYQERAQNLPMQFKVSYDPQRDRGKYFPLLTEISRGEKNGPDGVGVLQERVLAKDAAVDAIYRSTAEYYKHFFDGRLTVETPDHRLNQALRWDEVAIETSKVTMDGETGLTAGWYPSFDSARPGFGWYFGRDTLWTLYAVNSYGDKKLAKDALEFLARRQRDDGKIMHEFSLTAGSLQGDMDWSKLGYEYAAADATPLFIMAVHDYVKTTGDLDFLKTHWAVVQKAYAFDRSHDSDGDGVYDNSQGTGWVEAWPPVMPQQEIYLAALDQLSTSALADLADVMQDAALASNARSTANHIAESVAHYRQSDGRYAFSRNRDGSYDATATVYPAAAMWTSSNTLPQAETNLTGWAGHAFSSDWGVRAVAEAEKIYDPISYHQGSVWPLFTGWVAMAQYRSSKPMAGYAALMRNVDLTWAQDPGFVTEVISGRFFQPLGRSSSHQLWSSAMTLAPAVRGLFGVEVNALHRTLQVKPQLPADWDDATLNNVRVGDNLYKVTLHRERSKLIASVTSEKATVLCLNTSADSVCTEAARLEHKTEIALPAVQVSLRHQELPEAGAETSQPRIVSENYAPNSIGITLEAKGGTTVEIFVRRNESKAHLRSDQGKITQDTLAVTMPAQDGFVQQKVQLSW